MIQNAGIPYVNLTKNRFSRAASLKWAGTGVRTLFWRCTFENKKEGNTEIVSSRDPPLRYDR
jgi:hypothetical protein